MTNDIANKIYKYIKIVKFGHMNSFHRACTESENDRHGNTRAATASNHDLMVTII
jgi:hypothetical protein